MPETSAPASGFSRAKKTTELSVTSATTPNVSVMSRATSFASVAQQMSSAVGVAVAAASIETIQLLLGDQKLVARDMTLTFGVVALITLSSVALFARLKPDAGAEVSGKAVAAPRPLREAAE